MGRDYIGGLGVLRGFSLTITLEYGNLSGSTGGRYRTRTYDLSRVKGTLYQLS